MGLNVIVEDSPEFLDDFVSAQGSQQPAIHINGSFRLLECAGERDTQVSVLRFAGPVNDASHDRDFHFFNAGMAFFPRRHLLAQVGLDLLGHFLEEGAGGPSASTGPRWMPQCPWRPCRLR